MDALAAYDSSDEELSPRFDLQAIVQAPLAPQMYYVNTNVPDFNSNSNLTMYNGGNQSAHPAAIPLRPPAIAPVPIAFVPASSSPRALASA